jgi:ribonuclease P protein subunit POP4
MMPITESNIHQHELIGVQAEVGSSKNPSQNTVNGVIVDETMNTITISDGFRERMIQKKGTNFVLSLQNGCYFVIEGSRFLGRSVERVKNKSGGP